MPTRGQHAASPNLIAVLLACVALAPLQANAQTSGATSRLWDDLRYPAAGAYHDLVTRAEHVLSSTRVDAPRRQEAERDLAAAIRLSPARPQAWHVLGRLHAAVGEYEAAAKALAKAQRLDPQYLPRTVGYAFAMAALRAGRYLAAAAAFSALVGPKDPPRLAATLLGNAATAYLAAGHLKTSIHLYRQAVLRDVTYVPPRWGLAVASHRADQPTLAARLAKLALLLDPEARFLASENALFAPPSCRRYHEALAWEARGDPTRARAAWRTYLTEAPRSPWRPQVERALERLARTAGLHTPAAAPRPRRALPPHAVPRGRP